jgi:hypothetical protein
MPEDLFASEAVYRIVDGIFRLHRDLFEIESVIARTARIQVRLSRIRHDGQMGVIVAGLLAIVPVLISLGKIEWGSAPAITIYCIAGAVGLLWICQVMAAGEVSRELIKLEGSCSTYSLEDRLDFVLEETNAAVNRYKIVLSIVEQLKRAEQQATDDQTRSAFHGRRLRYEEIAQSLVDYVGSIIETSGRLVRGKKRSKEAHNELLDWAASIPKFAKRDAGS